jgi:hypothetical protein
VVSRIKTKKTKRLYCKKAILAAIACSFITACATPGPSTEEERRASLGTLIKQADSELAKGKNEQSIALLNQAAKENPTSMLPWLKMSNIWFNAGNYPSAILTANEVLQRESENQEAKSILVVAGLRVAAGAITGLIQPNPVNSSARVEAENLTKALRVALGEKVLVPGSVADNGSTQPAPTQHAHKRAATAPKRTVHATNDAPVASAAPASTAITTSSNGSDPFKSLK